MPLCDRCRAEIAEKDPPYGWEWRVTWYRTSTPARFPFDWYPGTASLGGGTFDSEEKAEAYKKTLLEQNPDTAVVIAKQPRAILINQMNQMG